MDEHQVQWVDSYWKCFTFSMNQFRVKWMFIDDKGLTD